MSRGFTLTEAAISAVILMVGAMALIRIGQTFLNQVTGIRQTQGHPPIAERLLHDQIQQIRASTMGATYPLVPPLMLGTVIYSIALVPGAIINSTQSVQIGVYLNGIQLPGSATVSMMKDPNF